MKNYIAIVFWCLLFCIEGCRCAREFEDENACSRSYVVIDVKPVNEESIIILESQDPSVTIVSSSGNKKSTLYVDLNEDLKNKTVNCTMQNGKTLTIEIYYSTRKRLLSIKKGAIVEYKIESVTCEPSRRCAKENDDYFTNLDKDADIQIFI